MTNDSNRTNSQQQAREFLQQANRRQTGLVTEFIHFLLNNKKWWLTPVILLLLLAAIVIVGGSAAGPFIYTLF